MIIFSLCKKIRHNNRNYRNRQRVPDIVVSNSEASEGDDVDAGEDAAMLGLGGASGVYVRQPQVLGLGKPLFRRLGSVAHTLQALGLGSRVMPSSQRADGIPPSGHTTLTEVPDLASTESPRRTALFRRCVAWHISRKWFGSRIAGNDDQS